MNNTYLIVNLVAVLLVIIAIFIFRKKMPDSYVAAGILCFIAPGFGQFYLETKHSFKFWLLFVALGKGFESAIPNSYLPWVGMGVLSSAIICYRISLKKSASTTPYYNQNPDTDYVKQLDNEMEAAGVDNLRDLELYKENELRESHTVKSLPPPK